MQKYYNLTDIEKANTDAGYHWFEPASKRFFRSRVGYQVYGGRYFISSEQYANHRGYVADRRYTIRYIDDDCRIRTLGEFQQYDSWQVARRALEKHLSEESASE